MAPEIFFIAPHPAEFTSGGNRYNTQLIGSLRLAGWKVRRFSPSDPRIKTISPGSLVVVDAIYRDPLLEGGFELPPHSRWAALIHYLPELDRLGAGAGPSWVSVFDLLLFPSEFLRTRFKDLYPGSLTPSFVLPPIIPIQIWPEAALKPGEIPKFVIVGNYLPVKGILEFLQQFVIALGQGISLPRFELAIYGSILDQSYWSACRNLADQFPALSKVILSKDIPRSRLLAVLSEATALVSPSSFESFGMAVAEAMALKRPVLALSRGNIPHLVSAYPAARLFDQMEELAMFLKEVIQEPCKAEDLYRSAKATPFEQRPFSPEQVIRQWEWIMDHFW
ncbi:MAG: glycosyltransferase family 4 protein [Haliscomenobacter sp.]|nr:glycosyltransferase family 4 protein [Haliscomenobacter sp.]